MFFQRLCGKGCGNRSGIWDNLKVRKDFVTKCTVIQHHTEYTHKVLMDRLLAMIIKDRVVTLTTICSLKAGLMGESFMRAVSNCGPVIDG